MNNLTRALAHVPQILEDRFVYSRSLRKNTLLDPRYRELAILTVGKITRAPYEVHHHTGPALKAGLSQAQIEAIEGFETSDLFDDRERAIIRFATELTRDVSCRDETWAALSRFLSVPELVELTLLVGWYNQTVRVLAALQIDIEA
ncbi:carboxymuconolactone decarboxylase family protein [Bosea sp. (in: a-proteobacteria)]|uniref:carboxymuconolactone decarboxylase family protein n=1 Tax=Bosea sp. (in: a-proteobacteria) TaxID=1871050 RepID=UPI00260FF342|nr:carboxymuconolactone decarboxylase family protein [Bosea sp. (in: a-proteobacteria)]MCO5090103.1 carboxymuconolactone decarboxylase family protein [Bosea sp. (in: a-proteobacteria)]